MVTRSAAADDDGRLFLVVNASRKEVDYAHIAEPLPAERAARAGAGARAARRCRARPRKPCMAKLSRRRGWPCRSWRAASGTCRRASTAMSRAPAIPARTASRFRCAAAKAEELCADCCWRRRACSPSASARATRCAWRRASASTATTSTRPPARSRPGLAWSIQKRRRERGRLPRRRAHPGRAGQWTQAQPRRHQARRARAGARRHRDAVAPAASSIGVVTSGGFGPSVNGPIAMGYVAAGSRRGRHARELDGARQGAARGGRAAAVRPPPLCPQELKQRGSIHGHRALHQGSRVDPRRWRHRHRRHHRITRRASSATSCSSSVPEVGPQGGAGRGGGGGRERQGGERRLRAGVRRGGRGQRRPRGDSRRSSTRTPRARPGSSRSRIANPAELDTLMDRAAYEAFVEGKPARCATCRSPTPTAAPCWPRSASPTSTRCSPTYPRTSGSTGLIDLPKAKGELEVERELGKLAAQNVAGRVGAVLRRRRRLQASRAGDRRSPDPALGVPDLLHALSAGDRPGHAAVPVRVPDAGGDADGHGGGQRLHVRRLDRDGRGRADGAPRHQAAARRCCPATCIRTIARPSRRWRGWPSTRSSRCRRRRGQGGPRRADRRHGVVRRRADARLLRPSARSHAARREGARRRRAAGRRGHGGRLAGPRAAAGRHGRRHRRRRGPSRSAMRSPSAGPTSACSPRARSTCGRCRDGCAARPSTRRAGAASC